MARCRECNAKVWRSAEYCQNCGARYPAKSSLLTDAPETRQSGFRISTPIGIILLGVILIAIAGSGGSSSNPSPSSNATKAADAAFDADQVAALLEKGATSTENSSPAPPQNTANRLKKLADWQYVPYPNMYDTTRLAFDANSIVVTNDERGNVNGADVTAHVVAGDVSIVGRYMVLSFDCTSHYRINHSYPLPLSSPTQESFVGDSACFAARCEILRRQGGTNGACPHTN